MATFTTTKNPNLVVFNPADIQFVNGSFTTEDARLIGLLRSIIAGANTSGIVETVVEADPNINAQGTADSNADQTNVQNLLNQGL